MAGIGFVLQKVLKEGGMTSLIKVALSGAIVVAGPWILSIIGIFFIGEFAPYAIAESHNLFIAIIIYSYAFSLFLFGGIHYIFTRHISDLIYEKKDREAGAALIIYSTIVIICSACIATITLSLLNLGHIRLHMLFKAASVLLFVSVNLIWLLMIFISLVNRYLHIFFTYLAGTIVSFVGVFILGRHFSAGGAMAGFAFGQFLIVVFLYIISFLQFKPGNFRNIHIGRYFRQYVFLFLSGMFYYWGMWIDKMVFWVFKGFRVGNTFFRLFDSYDIPVYFANLTMIPGLIYFVVISETDFFVHLTSFLRTLHYSIYNKIQEKKKRMIRSMKNGLIEQTLFQAIFTFVIILLAGDIARYLTDGMDTSIFRITLGAVFFHLLLLTISIFLYYIQLYRQAFIASLVFFTVNFFGSLVIVASGTSGFFGLSYLAAGIIASAVGGSFLVPSIYRFDRRIFLRAASGKDI
ncbi:MAG: exopolysaccharide Pel transporter PelG [Spirochaetales bacterium]|nr:exopolysaccharide Pel transporter PelG [Spirochaetales bacterium]